ncbi:hypothetical protein AB0H73_11560 [Streptomyces olivoreticuli]
MDLSLVSVDSTTARAHHDGAEMHVDDEVLTALEKAAAAEEKARQKGAARKDKPDRTTATIPHVKSEDASAADRKCRPLALT